MKTYIIGLCITLLFIHVKAQEWPDTLLDDQLLVPLGNTEFQLNQVFFQNFQNGLRKSFRIDLVINEINYVFDFQRKDLLPKPRFITTSEGKSYQDRFSKLLYQSSDREHQIYSSLYIFENRISWMLFIGGKSFILEQLYEDVYHLVPVKQPQLNEFSCETPQKYLERSVIRKDSKIKMKSGPRTFLELYVEVDYSIFTEMNSDIDATLTWVNSLYSQVGIIYDIHNIELSLAQIHIWTSPDPYMNINGLNNILQEFGFRLQNDFQGHTGQLLSARPLGGRAHLGKLCAGYDSEDHSGPYSVAAGLNPAHSFDPEYNYNTFLCAHELGHVLGAPHTNACYWGTENNEPLDNCFPPEGDCESGTTPLNGGTIMSYCFLNQSVGINFSLGFGEEPGQLIYENILNADCLSSPCTENSPCDDEDPCTRNDRWIECECIGQFIDFNNNSICDLTEPCEAIVNADTLTIPVNVVMASEMIISSSDLPFNTDMVFSTGNEIYFQEGFEVPLSSSFESVVAGCAQEH